MEKNHQLEQKWASQFRSTSIINFRIGVNPLFGRIAPRPPRLPAPQAHFATGQGGSGG
jgi:hypothetical protein